MGSRSISSRHLALLTPPDISLSKGLGTDTLSSLASTSMCALSATEHLSRGMLLVSNALP